MKTTCLILLALIVMAMTSCDSTDNNSIYDRAMDRQSYNQDLQRQQTMGSMFGGYGANRMISRPEDLYMIPQSR